MVLEIRTKDGNLIGKIAKNVSTYFGLIALSKGIVFDNKRLGSNDRGFKSYRVMVVTEPIKFSFGDLDLILEPKDYFKINED